MKYGSICNKMVSFIKFHPMKKILLLFSFLLFLQCGSIENYTTPDNKPALFNLNDIPAITLEFEVKDWNKLLTNYDLNPSNEKKVVSRFSFDVNGSTIVLDSIGLRLRGNTSRRRPEGNPGDLHNAANPDWRHVHFALDFSKNRADQRFKGLNKLNLKWFKDDPNYCREIYSYDLFARYGCWNAPRASYCKLTVKVKGDAKPAYYGVYAMIENIDEDFLTKNQDKWGSGIGFLWKGGWADTNATFTPSSTQSIGVEDVNIDPSLSVYYAYDLKTRKDELPAAQAELTQFITDLNTKTGTAFQTWIAQKMDVPLFLRTMATHVMLGMWDDYWVNGNNFYFYFAPNGKAYFIPYDYDNTLGTSQIMENTGTQDPLKWGNMTKRPLITKILEIPQYQALYKSYVKELINPNNDLFTASRSIERIQTWQNRIENAVPNDTGEDMSIDDKPASWGNQPNYRLKTGNNRGGIDGPANYFLSRAASITW